MTKNRFNIPAKKYFNEFEIVQGHLIEKMDKFYEMLTETPVHKSNEMIIVHKWADYLKKKNIPHVITKRKRFTSTYVNFWVYGVKIETPRYLNAS